MIKVHYIWVFIISWWCEQNKFNTFIANTFPIFSIILDWLDFFNVFSIKFFFIKNNNWMNNKWMNWISAFPKRWQSFKQTLLKLMQSHLSVFFSTCWVEYFYLSFYSTSFASCLDHSKQMKVASLISFELSGAETPSVQKGERAFSRKVWSARSRPESCISFFPLPGCVTLAGGSRKHRT